MPPQRGRVRRTCWRPSTITLFKPSVVPWTPFTNCQKKGAVPTRPPVRRLSPHLREQGKGDGKNTYWSSPLRPNDSRGQQTKRREGSLPLPFDASPPFINRGRIYTFTPLQTLPLSAETLINEKPLGSLVPGASVPMTRPAHAPPGKAT